MTTSASAGPTSPVISLDHVHLAYPGADVEALSDLTLQIPAGQNVCILGGNGSGKSTLLQLVNALALPTSGEVSACGMSTSDPALSLKIRARTASVFQHPEDQMVTSIVADDVAFGPENLRVPQPSIARRVESALAAVNMTEHAQSDPSDLSGGQTQRVAIAGAIAMEPEILLLDEPCAMLDAEGRESVRGIISQLHEQGITILHVTHFMEDARSAERVIVLDRGAIAFDGPPAELFEQPQLVNELGLEMPRRAVGPNAPASGPQPVGPNAPASGPQPGGSPTATTASRTSPSVVFDRVSFSYAQAANPRKRSKGRALFGRARGGNATGPSAGDAPLAVDSISFEAHPGTLTALIGRTGSGKSTTAELACALKLPSSGSVRIAGIDTSDLERRKELRRLVGYVAQLPERQLFAETVFDDVAFGPRNLGLSPEEVEGRVRAALRSVNNIEPTDALLRTSPFALSGGQQRSVALAGVLAMQQPILVLDEPMAGLDPRGRARVRELIRVLKRAGTTLLMVTHSMEDVAELADQVVALAGGRRVDPSLAFDSREVGSHGAAC